MSFKISDNVDWIGKIDWELRRFHGEQLSTYKGSSYNAYLIKDEKNVVIDSVWRPFSEEYIQELKKNIDLNKIDYIVANHAEPDHSGGLPALIELIPNVPVICTANGAKSLKGYYHKDWNFKIVKTGDRIDLGSGELVFIEAAMLHWPDTMMTYYTNGNILFSNDVFGQHYASEAMYADKCDTSELMYEALKYFANIVAPFSSKSLKKMHEFIALGLPVSLIAPAHGVMWRENPLEIVEQYIKWSDNYSEDQVTLIYDTMYDSTRRMAEEIAAGIKEVSPETTLKLYNSSKSDSSDVTAEVFRSKAILVGSPAYNTGILNSTAAILEEIKGLSLTGKKGAAFGSYGWAPTSVKIINELLKEAGYETLGTGLKAQWNPDENMLESCRQFGRDFAAFIGE